jgi:predicted DNA-binding protein (UPF0251 family)
LKTTTLHPETKAGVAQALGMHRALGHNIFNQTSDNVTATVAVTLSQEELEHNADVPTFTEDTALKTRLSQRTIWEDIQIATRILPEVRDILRNTELAEIDENLIRAELTILERAEHLARRKEIYETLHPETKAGVAQALGMNRALGYDVAVLGTATFTEDTAQKTGLAQRTIQRDIQIATRILPEVRDALRNTELADSKRDLLRIARLDNAT